MTVLTRISPHFTVPEVLTTDFTKYARCQRVWFTSERAIAATRLAYELLEPLREVIGRPIITTSWLRCPDLNAVVGGSPSSQHVTGRAVDFVIPGGDLWMAYDALEFSGVGQRILYLSVDKEPLWIHLSLPDPRWEWDRQNVAWVTDNGFRQRSLVCYPTDNGKLYEKYRGGREFYI